MECLLQSLVEFIVRRVTTSSANAFPSPNLHIHSFFCISHKPPQASLKSFFAKLDFSLFSPQIFGASVTLYLIAMLQNAHKKPERDGGEKTATGSAFCWRHRRISLAPRLPTFFIEDLNVFVFSLFRFPWGCTCYRKSSPYLPWSQQTVSAKHFHLSPC